MDDFFDASKHYTFYKKINIKKTEALCKTILQDPERDDIMHDRNESSVNYVPGFTYLRNMT